MSPYNWSSNSFDKNPLLLYHIERERLVEEVTSRVIDRLSVSGSFHKNMEKIVDETVEKILHEK